MPAVKGVRNTSHLGDRTKLGELGCVDVKVCVEISASHTLLRELCRMPWQPPVDSSAPATEETPAEKAFTGLDPVTLKQNQDRLLRWIALPVLLQMTLATQTGACIGVASWLVLVFWIPLWLWPLLLWSCLLANGILTMRQRKASWRKGDDLPADVCPYRVWDDQIGSREMGGKVSQGLQVQYVLFEAQEGVGRLAAVLEKITGLLSFSDPAMSIVSFCGLFFASLMVGLVFFALPTHLIMFGVGASAIVGGHLCYHDLESVEDYQGRMNQELLEARYGLKTKMLKVMKRNGSDPALTMGKPAIKEGQET